MKYCENCHELVDNNFCPNCGKETRCLMPTDYCFLVEHQEIQARMIMSLLDANNIVHIDIPVLGSGLTMSTSSIEIFKIYVPYKDLQVAQALIRE